MKQSIVLGMLVACMGVGLSASPLAAEPATTGTVSQPSPSAAVGTDNVAPSTKCLDDLRVFDKQMEKDGYWLGGAGFSFGYPMGGFGYAYPMGGHVPVSSLGYRNVRPGYEVRVLLASANILARHGQQQPCEDVLGSVRAIYSVYVADMHSGGMRTVNLPDWQQQEIASARPVTSGNTAFRSDQLLGTDVRTPKNEALGSVDDIVMSPQTGKVAYLVVARGGIFGIGEKYVPVPWEDFRASANLNLLVLDTTIASMNAAPLVSHEQFTTAGHFDPEGQKVDAYWKTHLSKK